MSKLLLLNGPNLNLLGIREPSHYGHGTLADIEAAMVALARADGHDLECLQSNAEHVLLDRLHRGREEGVAYAIINPGAFTHTSIALRDAFLGTGIPFVEVHLSNIHQRETFRHHSYLSDIAAGTIVGFGPLGYELAYRAVACALDGEAPGSVC